MLIYIVTFIFNLTSFKLIIDRFINNYNKMNKLFLPIDCRQYHDSCELSVINKLIQALKYTFKIYSFAHGIPMIIFKNKEILSKPIESITKLIDSILRSMCFLSTYIISIRIFHCYVYSKLLGRFDCKITL